MYRIHLCSPGGVTGSQNENSDNNQPDVKIEQIQPPEREKTLKSNNEEVMQNPYLNVNPIFDFNFNYSRSLETKLGVLLKNNKLTDIEFSVGDAEEKIRAHKLILALSSPVFMTMFYGSFQCQDVIRIPDCNPEAFRGLINFAYGLPVFKATDNSKENMEPNTLPVLYAAHKYDMKSLEDQCVGRLKSVLSVWNVLTIMSTAEMYQLPELTAACWNLIQRNTRSVLNFNLHSMDYEMLLRVVQDDKLSIDEVRLFEFINTWAEIECVKGGVDASPENKRLRLGKTLYFIRYPTMTSSDFANRVVQKRLLNNDQVAQILTYICSSPKNRESLPIDFCVTKRRQLPESCCESSPRLEQPPPDFLRMVTEDPNYRLKFMF